MVSLTIDRSYTEVVTHPLKRRLPTPRSFNSGVLTRAQTAAGPSKTSAASGSKSVANPNFGRKRKVPEDGHGQCLLPVCTHTRPLTFNLTTQKKQGRPPSFKPSTVRSRRKTCPLTAASQVKKSWLHHSTGAVMDLWGYLWPVMSVLVSCLYFKAVRLMSPALVCVSCSHLLVWAVVFLLHILVPLPTTFNTSVVPHLACALSTSWCEPARFHVRRHHLRR